MLLYNTRVRNRYSTPYVIYFVWQVKRRVVSLLPTYSFDDSSQPPSHIQMLAHTEARTDAYIWSYF